MNTPISCDAHTIPMAMRKTHFMHMALDDEYFKSTNERTNDTHTHQSVYSFESSFSLKYSIPNYIFWFRFDLSLLANPFGNEYIFEFNRLNSSLSMRDEAMLLINIFGENLSEAEIMFCVENYWLTSQSMQLWLIYVD